MLENVKCIDQVIDKNYAIYNGDSCEIVKGIPNDSVHFSVFSPPFADLYTYSDSLRDMGNCRNYGEFWDHFKFLIAELYRITKPGRLVSFHCMDLVLQKEKDGFLGLRDFSGDLIREFQEVGFVYHSKVTIWKDPLLAAVRTKTIGLMHKQLCKDSTVSRQGVADYLITMKKPGENAEPVTHGEGLTYYAGSDTIDETGIKYSHMIWRKYASPVWMDIRATRVLQASVARDEQDEKHICPLQLDVIHRALVLWSNPGDVVFSPFMGIASEGYESVLLDRKFIGIELKESYFRQAKKNMKTAQEKLKENSRDLFTDIDNSESDDIL